MFVWQRHKVNEKEAGDGPVKTTIDQYHNKNKMSKN